MKSVKRIIALLALVGMSIAMSQASEFFDPDELARQRAAMTATPEGPEGQPWLQAIDPNYVDTSEHATDAPWTICFSNAGVNNAWRVVGWTTMQAEVDLHEEIAEFIHVDAARAAKTPFGKTIAHGYLTMSLISYFAGQCGVRPDNTIMAINYGSDKVRFLQPVKVDSRIRARAALQGVEERDHGQTLLKTRFTIEIEGEEKPAMVADILSLFISA